MAKIARQWSSKEDHSPWCTLHGKACKAHPISLTGPSHTGVCFIYWTLSFHTNCPERAPWSGNLQPCCCTPLGRSSRTSACTCQIFKLISWECYKNLAYCNMISLMQFIHYLQWALRTSLNAKVWFSLRHHAFKNKWITNRVACRNSLWW